MALQCNQRHGMSKTLVNGDTFPMMPHDLLVETSVMFPMNLQLDLAPTVKQDPVCSNKPQA